MKHVLHVRELVPFLGRRLLPEDYLFLLYINKSCCKGIKFMSQGSVLLKPNLVLGDMAFVTVVSDAWMRILVELCKRFSKT